MSSLLVIEHFDVIEQLHLGVGEAGELVGQLAFDRREEALHDGIVVTMASAAHAADHATRSQTIPIVFAGVR